MTNKIKADEIITQGHNRIWRQPGGAGANNPVRYAGVTDQYLAISGVSRAVRGAISPINVPDPTNRKRFRQVGRTEEAADFSSFDVQALSKHGSIPFTLADLTCPHTYYVASGKCKRPDDFLRGWDDYVVILANALVTESVDMGDLTAAWDSDDAVSSTLSYTCEAIYGVGKIGFGEVAGPEVGREVVDVVYGSAVECGDCGPGDDGTQRIYYLVKASGGGSPGLPSEIVYTTTGGLAWAEATITGLGATVDATAIELVGDKLIVLVYGEDAYYYATVNAATGVPGTFTKVTSGFVAAGSPLDWYVLDSSNIFIVGEAGYIYKLSSVGDAVSVLSAGTVSTQTLYRIDGDGDTTIVIVGAAATVLKSINRGLTFASTTTVPATGSNVLQAVAVIDSQRYWVGSSQGYLYATINGGETWAQSRFSGDQAGAIYDIIAVSPEVLYLSHSTATPTARIFSTWNGAASNANWTNEAPRINNLPTANRFNRLAAPTVGASVNGLTTASNYLAVAGLSGGGTDGIALIGAASIL